MKEAIFETCLVTSCTLSISVLKSYQWLIKSYSMCVGIQTLTIIYGFYMDIVQG